MPSASDTGIVEHEPGDLTCIVDGTLPLSALQSALAQHGQRFSLDPPGDPTLADCLLRDLSGPLRHRFGTMRDLVIGVGVVLPDGTHAHSGGKVVKNVAGYDLGEALLRLGRAARDRRAARPAAASSPGRGGDDRRRRRSVGRAASLRPRPERRRHRRRPDVRPVRRRAACGGRAGSSARR